MDHLRAALYLDFDNVFGGLYKLDPEAAILFATDPGSWLCRLSTSTVEAPRRWLVLRCYLNPSGWVHHLDHEGEQTRLFFSRFRPSFVRAGFEVIDCPRYSGTKNAADIRIVVDAVDALSADTRYDEFVIASGDSDMTPLLQRLRRSDRRTAIVSPADAAEAFTAIADQVVESQRLLALVEGEPFDLDDDGDQEADVESGRDLAGVAGSTEGYEVFRPVLTREYEEAARPLNMASLASRLRTQLGSSVGDSNWFGFGSFARAVAGLDLPNLRMSQHFLWDDRRHQAPEPSAAAPPRVLLADPVERLADQLDLPRLPESSWPVIYQTLSDYAQSHHFNLTQCTSWSRDQLRERGVAVSRSAVAFVVRGTSFGGCPLHRQPSPTAAEVGEAFIGNVLARAEAAEVGLSADEITTVRAWLGDGDGEATVDPANGS